jgi:hypothetical protein
MEQTSVSVVSPVWPLATRNPRASVNVLAATHVHLDADKCLEVAIMKGRSGEVRHLPDPVPVMRVKHGKPVIITIGKRLNESMRKRLLY